MQGLIALWGVLFSIAVGFLVYALIAPEKTETVVSCVTKDAQLLSKSTKDGKYITFWCVKNGRVVP